MKNFWAYIILFAIVVYSTTRANGDSSIQQTTGVPTENSEEGEKSVGLSHDVLQDNYYRNGFYQLIEFMQTTSSTLTKLHNKLDDLEKKIEVLNTESVLLKAGVEAKTTTESLKQEIASLKANLTNDRTSHSREIKNLKSQIENNSGMERNAEVYALLSSVSSNLNGLKRAQNIIQNNISSQAATISSVMSKNSKITSALFERNPEAFLDFLPSPRNGKSFNGSTFEAISAAVPTDNMLVAQIKNYMDVDLTGYQLYLAEGFVAAPAPNKIFAKTAEVATFESNKKLNFAATPEMSYRIGDTDISLHLYFIHGETVQTFASALLPRSAPAKSIISFD